MRHVTSSCLLLLAVFLEPLLAWSPPGLKDSSAEVSFNSSDCITSTSTTPSTSLAPTSISPPGILKPFGPDFTPIIHLPVFHRPALFLRPEKRATRSRLGTKTKEAPVQPTVFRGMHEHNDQAPQDGPLISSAKIPSPSFTATSISSRRQKPQPKAAFHMPAPYLRRTKPATRSGLSTKTKEAPLQPTLFRGIHEHNDQAPQDGLLSSAGKILSTSDTDERLFILPFIRTSVSAVPTPTHHRSYPVETPRGCRDGGEEPRVKHIAMDLQEQRKRREQNECFYQEPRGGNLRTVTRSYAQALTTGNASSKPWQTGNPVFEQSSVETGSLRIQPKVTLIPQPNKSKSMPRNRNQKSEPSLTPLAHIPADQLCGGFDHIKDVAAAPSKPENQTNPPNTDEPPSLTLFMDTPRCKDLKEEVERVCTSSRDVVKFWEDFCCFRRLIPQRKSRLSRATRRRNTRRGQFENKEFSEYYCERKSRLEDLDTTRGEPTYHRVALGLYGRGLLRRGNLGN